MSRPPAKPFHRQRVSGTFPNRQRNERRLKGCERFCMEDEIYRTSGIEDV